MPISSREARGAEPFREGVLRDPDLHGSSSARRAFRLFEMNAEIVNDTYASGKHEGAAIFTRDWARTRAEAAASAENTRVARIASLKKSIAKLEKLKF